MFAHESHESLTDPAYLDAQDEAYYAARDEAYPDDMPDPEQYVSEDDYWQPTPREREELQVTDDMLANWDAYRRIVV